MASPLAPSVALAFFASGFAGLMHQVVWSKLLVHVIGATAYAQAVVLAVFMGGLAAGARWGGRVADRSGRPLRFYVLLEVGVALYCALLPVLTDAAAALYVPLAGVVFEQPGLTLGLRFGLAALLVLAPAAAMGATLPALARHVITRADETQQRVGTLYALNSFGAVLGAGVTGFVALPVLGLVGSVWSASAVNLLAAGVVLPGVRRERAHAEVVARERMPTATPAPPGADRWTRHAPLLALALSGFAAMGYEVLFIRVIGLSFGSSSHSFTIMLMAFIAGIALGSAWVSRRRVSDPLLWFGWSQVAVVLSLLAATPLVSRLAYLTDVLRLEVRGTPAGYAVHHFGIAGLCLAMLLVPTACLGVGFPLVARIQAHGREDLGGRIGTTYAWNTVGNVLGVLVTSLVLLPALGLLGGLHLNLALNAGAALLALAAADRRAPRRARAGWSAAGVLALASALHATLGAGWLDPVRYARNHLRASREHLDLLAARGHAGFDAWRALYTIDARRYRLLYFAEDSHASVAVSEGQHLRSLLVNTKPDAGTSTDMGTQQLLGHVPLFARPDAADVLVIGYGGGFTVGSVLTHPVARVDVVEISPAVLGAHPFFADENGDALHDARVHVYVEDGQSFVRAVPRRYDVVVSEPSNPWIAGMGDLFTLEFFQAVRARLHDDGVFVVWFHTYDQSDEAIVLVMRTLAQVFPHVEVFHDVGYIDMIALASAAPLAPDFDAMEARFERPAVSDDLARIGVVNLAGVLLHHGVADERLRARLGDGPLNRARHQRLEYLAMRAFFDYQDSTFVEQLDPLFGGEAASSLWLDRYLTYRRDEGEPVTVAELDALHRTVVQSGPPSVAASLQQRAAAAPAVPPEGARRARGGRPPAEAMGFNEAVYWSERLDAEGQPDESRRHLERARALRPDHPRVLRFLEAKSAAGGAGPAPAAAVAGGTP